MGIYTSTPVSAYVVTGTPATARMSLIEGLTRRGYKTLPNLLLGNMKKYHVLDLRKLSRTSRHNLLVETVHGYLDWEAHTQTGEACFLDGSIAEIAVLCSLGGLRHPDVLRKVLDAERQRYRTVFMLDHHEGANGQVPTLVGKIAVRDLLLTTRRTYETLGCNVVKIPPLSQDMAVDCVRSWLSFPTMLLGLPRSGTNFLSSVVRAHPQISMQIEPLSLHLGFVRQNFGRFWREDHFDEHFFHTGLLGSQADSQFLGSFRAAMTDESVCDKRVFKETAFFLKMRWLKRFLPKLHIVYLHRNLSAVVASFENDALYRKWNYEEIFNRMSHEVRKDEDLRKYRYLLSAVDTRSELDKLVFVCIVRRRELFERLELFPSLSLNYEDAIRNHSQSLAHIAGFLGVGVVESMHRAAERRREAFRGGMYSTYRRSSVDSENVAGLSRITDKRIRQLEEVGGVR